MPKELTHWWLAAEALHRLPTDSHTRQLLENNLSAYLVGASLPDTLLHLLHGPSSATALRLADAFHNTVENSYRPLVQFAEQGCTPADIGQECPLNCVPAVTACLLGVASHMEADIVFHPFVYAQAGDDIGTHYRIETELDLWLLNRGHLPPVYLLRDLLTDETSAAATKVMTGIFDPHSELPATAISKALNAHATIQGMYSNPFWQRTAQLLGLLPGTPVRNWRWLFYPPKRRQGRDRYWPARWTDPATGQERNDTPADLLTDVVGRITELLGLVDNAGLIDALRKQPGENLLTGLPVHQLD